MVTLYSNGITITVPAAEASIYIRAGYEIVSDAPVKLPKQDESPLDGEPVIVKKTAKKTAKK
jgi:hypothetical protein